MSGPLVGKRRLGAELRRLRRDRELAQDQVVGDMEWSPSKLIRIENGTVAISVSDLRSLLAYYSVHGARSSVSLDQSVTMQLGQINVPAALGLADRRIPREQFDPFNFLILLGPTLTPKESRPAM